MDIVKAKQFVVCTGKSSLRCIFDILTRVKNTSCLCSEVYLMLINSRASVPSPLVLPVTTQSCWAEG